MSDLSIKAPSISPGDALRLQRQTQQRTHAYGQLAVALQRGDVAGDQVTRLHTMIGGSLEDLQHAELELSLQRLLSMRSEMQMSTLRSLR